MKNIILPLILIISLIATFWFLYAFDPFADFDKVVIDWVARPEKTVPVEELSAFSSSQSEFSFDLFRQIAGDEENTFVSPYSIHSALTLAFLGAEGKTKEEMEEILRFIDMEEEAIKRQALGLKRHLERVSKSTEVSVGNALFLRDDIPFRESYKQDGERYFEAKLSPLPFTGTPINQWVREKTNQKIEEIIDSGPIDKSAIAYLVNAIYFKGMWEIEFDEERTSLRPFYGKEEREVKMMEGEEEYYHYISDDLQAVTLEYEKGNYLFHAVMPGENSSLEEFYKELSKERMEEIRENMYKGEIVLRMPKFIMEEDLQLKEILIALGMTDAFHRQNADFSKMVDIDDLELNVFISEVFHSSFIEIDEKGTEAAAATAVEMELVSMPTVIEFNSPFFFMIEEANTGTILFMGQLINPS